MAVLFVLVAVVVAEGGGSASAVMNQCGTSERAGLTGTYIVGDESMMSSSQSSILILGESQVA